MPVISAALCFLVAGGGGPGGGQVQQAVPVHALNHRQKQLRGALQTEDLNLFSAERRNAGFRHPNWFASDRADFLDLLRPIMDLPVVPIQREAVHGDNIDRVKDSIRTQELNEMRINGRDAAQDQRQLRIFAVDRLGRGDDHLSKHLPIRVQLEIPMGEIVWFIPKHHCFNHARTLQKLWATSYRVPANSWSKIYLLSSRVTWEGTQIQVSCSGCARISRPELRSMASMAPWFGIHQFVGSPAYFFSIKYMLGKSERLKISVFQK